MNTKRLLALLLTLCMVFSLAVPGFASADELGEIIEGENNTQNDNNYEDRGAISGDTLEAEVRFNLNGAPGEVATQYVAIGGYVTEPEAPTREGYTFAGWYEDFGEMGAAPFDFGTPIAGPVELTAFWTPTISEEELQSVLNTQFYSTQLGDSVTGDSGETPVNVAQIGETGYATLAAAFEAANEATSAVTIELLDDVTDFPGTTIASGKTITLDLNGHSVTTAEESTGRHAYLLQNNGTFTLKDSNPGQSNGVFARGIDNESDGVMIIDGGYSRAVDSNGGAAIWNEGTLTINSGTFEACNLNTNALYNAETGKVTMNNGNVSVTYVGSVSDPNGPCALFNKGTVNIHGGTITSASERCYAVINSGTMVVDETKGAVTVSGAHGALSCDEGTLTVDGGSFTSQNYYGLWITNDGNCTEVTVNGGSFQGGSKGLNALRASVDDGKQDVGDATITITGGSFKGYGNNAAAVAVNKSGSEHSWGMAISGGLFSTKPDSSYLAEGYEAVENDDGTWTVQAVRTYVAKIGDVKYETLAEAIAAVPDNTETTITIIANQTINVVGSALTIPANKNVVLDLNGFEVVGTAGEGKTSALITNNGTLTITDSSNSSTGKLISGATPTWTWDGSDDYSGSYASNLISNYGTLTVNSGNLKNVSSGSAAYAIDNYSAGKVTINGGKIDAAKASAIRLFYNNGGWIKVTGGSIGHYNSEDDRSYMGIQVMSGANADVTISGGTIDGVYSVYTNDTGTSAVSITGGTFPGDVGFGSKGSVTISISGGTFNEVSAWGNQTAFISGGIYSEKPDPAYIADGKCVVANTDEETRGTYPYAIGNAIIDVNGVGYGTLADAFAAANEAQSGAVITLLADCDTGDAAIGAPLALTNTGATLDLNGKTITVNNNFSLVMQGDNITVRDGRIASGRNEGKTTKINSYVLVINDCSGVLLSGLNMMGGLSIGGSQDDWGTVDIPTIDGVHGAGAAYNVVIENCNITSGDYYAVCSQMNSTATIKSGIFTANPDYSGSRVLHGYFVGTDGPEGKIFVTGGKFMGAINTSNNGWIYLEGGVYSVEPDAGLIATGYEAKANTGADKDQYPYAIGEHVHTFTYDNAHAIWHWSVVNGSWTAKVTYKCTTCDNGLETHNASVSGPVAVEGGKNRYTATDNDYPDVSTYRDFVTTYTITYQGTETTHKYGDAFKAEADTAKDWYVTEVGGTRTLRAKGLATFYLPVTANATVEAEDASTAKQEPTAAGSTSVTIDNNKATAVYKVKWSLPDTAQITSEKIYRATSAHNNTKVDQDMVIRLGAQYTVDLNVRNGDFTYTVSNLTPEKDLHLVLEIKYTYTEDGVTKTGTLTDYKVVYLTNS